MQVQQNNFCNFFIGKRQSTCRFEREVVVGDALYTVNMRKLNKCYDLALDRRMGDLVVIVAKEEQNEQTSGRKCQVESSSPPNMESSDTGVDFNTTADRIICEQMLIHKFKTHSKGVIQDLSFLSLHSYFHQCCRPLTSTSNNNTEV